MPCLSAASAVGLHQPLFGVLRNHFYFGVGTPGACFEPTARLGFGWGITPPIPIPFLELGMGVIPFLGIGQARSSDGCTPEKMWCSRFGRAFAQEGQRQNMRASTPGESSARLRAWMLVPSQKAEATVQRSEGPSLGSSPNTWNPKRSYSHESTASPFGTRLDDSAEGSQFPSHRTPLRLPASSSSFGFVFFRGCFYFRPLFSLAPRKRLENATSLGGRLQVYVSWHSQPLFVAQAVRSIAQVALKISSVPPPAPLPGRPPRSRGPRRAAMGEIRETP